MRGIGIIRVVSSVCRVFVLVIVRKALELVNETLFFERAW